MGMENETNIVVVSIVQYGWSDGEGKGEDPLPLVGSSGKNKQICINML